MNISPEKIKIAGGNYLLQSWAYALKAQKPISDRYWQAVEEALENPSSEELFEALGGQETLEHIKCNINTTIDVLALPYFGPNNNKDAMGQYFSPETDFMDGLIDQPPVFLHHGSVNGEGTDTVGEVVNRWYGPEGGWMKVSLDKKHPRYKDILRDHKMGLLRASTGAVPASIVVAEDGHILRWLVGELSLVLPGDGYVPVNGYAITKAVVFEDYYGEPVESQQTPFKESILNLFTELREKLSNLFASEEIVNPEEIKALADEVMEEVKALEPEKCEACEKQRDALNWVRATVKAGKLPPAEALKLIEQFRENADNWEEIKEPIEQRTFIKAMPQESLYIAGGNKPDVQKSIDQEFLNKQRRSVGLEVR